MSKKFLNLITYVDASGNDQIIDLQTSVSPNTVPLRDENGVFEVGDVGSNDDNSYVINKKYITDKLDDLDSSSSSDTFVFGVHQTNGKITTDKGPLDDHDGVLLTGNIKQDVYGEKIFGGNVTFTNGATYSSSIDDNSSDLLLINKKYTDKKLGVLSLDDSASVSSFDNVGNFVRAAIAKSGQASLDGYLRLSTSQGESDQTLSQPAIFEGDNSFDSSVEFYRMLRSSEPSKPNDVINYSFYLEATMGKDNLMLAKVESSTGGSYTIGVKKSPGLNKINWGDGSIEYIDSANSYEHVYVDGSAHYEMFYGVESIASDAFREQSCLKEITIPDGVTSIGSSAFNFCSGLTSVTIGNGVKNIVSYAFNGCSRLTSVYYMGDIAGWCGISFSDITSNPLYYAHNLYISNELVTNLVIPDTVKEIKAYVFSYYSGLTSVIIPDSVTSIGSNAFYVCDALTSVTIGNGMTSIGSNAFRFCSSLTSITIPDSVTSIGERAFEYCSRLTSVTATRPTPATLGTDAFSNTASDFKIHVPSNLVLTYQSAWSAYSDKIVAI